MIQICKHIHTQKTYVYSGYYYPASLCIQFAGLKDIIIYRDSIVLYAIHTQVPKYLCISHSTCSYGVRRGVSDKSCPYLILAAVGAVRNVLRTCTSSDQCSGLGVYISMYHAYR